MSDSLRPHGLQHARLLCPSLSARVCSDSGPLSWWCHPTIWSSVTPFSSCLQSFPASGSFPMSWLFTSGSQSIGALASASVLATNIQDWFKIDCFDVLAIQGTLKSLFQHQSSKASILQHSAFFIVWFSQLLEKEMAPHSSILAWKIPWMEEPGRLQSMGSQRVGHDWGTSLTHSLICTWLQEKPQLWIYRPLSAKWCLCFLICCLGLS